VPVVTAAARRRSPEQPTRDRWRSRPRHRVV